MADRQAYHVSKGLECIKAIRGSTIKKEQLQELHCIFEEASSDESRSSVGAPPGEKGSIHLMESTTSTIGSGDDGPLYSVLSHTGSGTHSLPSANASEERADGPTLQLQCSEIHDNSSQEIDGHEDLDNTVVPTGSFNTGQLSQGARRPDESASDPSDTDPLRSSTPNGGPVARFSPEKFCDVTTVTGEELTVLLNKEAQKPSSSKVTKILKIPPAPEFLPESIDSESIKKGTEGKSISSGKGTASGSIGGAIPCVQKSPRSASEPSAHVEIVPSSVTTAATILEQSQDDGILTSDDESSS
ncbi:V protein [Myotis bat morbillivirus]|nr:V protein [Myotis bat morbillivirus]